MKRVKKPLSIFMALVLLMGVFISPTIQASTVADPWVAGAAWPNLTSISNLKTNQSYFTYKEWTGEVNSKDNKNQAVRQSDVVAVNTELAHSSNTLPYDSVANAKQGAIEYKPELSPYYQLLTGAGQPWDLTVYKSPADADKAGISSSFYKNDFTGVQSNPYTGHNTVSSYTNADFGCGWKSVTLPASWQTQGFDFPIYTNIDTPWSGVYGNVTASSPLAPTVTNPTGFYRRSFDVDPTWLQNGKKVYISFQGVESSMYLYVNGNQVGYTEDSFDAHNFDITPFLNSDGKGNVLAVRVQRWCDGSWLEDQDKIRLAGIFRDVYLYATPAINIRDYKVETDLDSNFVNANLKLNLNIQNKSTTAASSYGVDVKLFDAEGNNIFSSSPLLGDVPDIASGNEGTLDLNRLVNNPRLWSDEDPYLYTLVISLYDKTTKKLFESTSQQLGFREISFTKTNVDSNYNKTATNYQNITINGKSLFFKGVNRSDIDGQTGKYVSKELYEQDIKMMKQNNINALRTSHYPNDQYEYYLCDKYGMLVLSEANMECHALSGDSDTMASYFTNVYNDRVISNMEAQKNRTSVVMWSLGNECGSTPNSKMFQKSIQNIVRPIDSTRPVHYEGIYDGGGVDVASNMYATVSDVISRADRADNMPYMQCEYSHAMGNAVGNLKEYMDAFHSRSNILGGFIWDWVDQSIATPLPAPLQVTADVSANNFVGTLNGAVVDNAVWGKVMTGYATYPSDSNANIDKLNNALSGRNPFTLEMQVNPKNEGSQRSLLTKGDHQVAMRYDGTYLDFYVYAGGAWIQNKFNLPSNWGDNWHQIATEFDGTNLTAFCDGIQLSLFGNNSTVNADINKSTNDFAINYEVENPSRVGHNQVAKVRIYNKALTSAELIAQNAGDKGTGTYAIAKDSSNVVMWLDFKTATTKVVSNSVWDYYASIGNQDWAGKFEGYGGDWGDVINSGTFCANGLVSTDRTPQPELAEVKYQYQPISFSSDTKSILNRQVNIINQMSFLNTDNYSLSWNLVEDGKVIGSGDIQDSVAAKQTKTISIPFTMPQQLKPDGEYYLNLYAKLKSDTLYAKKDYVVATGQIRVPATISKAPSIDTSTISAITKTDAANTITLSGQKFSLVFNKTTGLISNYTYDGKTVLTAGPTPNYWRTGIDNDRGVDNTWANANQNMQVSEFTATPSADGKTVSVNVKLNLSNAKNSTQTMQYIIYGSGEVAVKADLQPGSGLGEMLKYGAELTLPKGYENITWYGAGPQETFQDRKQGAPIGVYQTTVTDSFFPYISPQTCGNHTDVRYIALEDPANPTGLMVVSKDVMEASALHFSTVEMMAKTHPYLLPQTNHTVLNIDCLSRGLGGASCGPLPLDQYRMSGSASYSYSYTIVPYTKASANLMDLSKVYRDVESFDQAAFDKSEAARIDSLIDQVNNVLLYSQKSDIEAARNAYNGLSAAQKAIVTKLNILVAAENKIETLKDSKAYVKDQSSNKIDAELTDTAKILKDSTSPTGFSMTGYFSVKNNLINNKISGTKPFSMEVWVNPSDLQDYNVFMAKGDTQAVIQANKGGIEFCIYDGGGWYAVNPTNIAGWTVNNWHHIVGTYDGSTLKLYLDGKLLNQNTVNKSVSTNNFDLGIGICTENTGRRMRGKLGAARIYTAALSASDVQLRYQADMGENVTAIGPNNTNVLLWYDLSDAYNVGVTPINPSSSDTSNPSATSISTSGPSNTSNTEYSSSSNTSNPNVSSDETSGSSNTGNTSPNTGEITYIPFALFALILSGLTITLLKRRKKIGNK